MQTREIKFRIWNGMSMEYNVLAGQLGVFYAPGLSMEDNAFLSRFNTIYPDDTPVMQYTGMKDKNGIEIYEGDILNHGYCIRQGIFETDHLKRGMLTWILERENSSVVAICDQNMILPYEITGNIYQNPELL